MELELVSCIYTCFEIERRKYIRYLEMELDKVSKPPKKRNIDSRRVVKLTLITAAQPPDMSSTGFSRSAVRRETQGRWNERDRYICQGI